MPQLLNTNENSHSAQGSVNPGFMAAEHAGSELLPPCQPAEAQLRSLDKQDYDRIVQIIDKWWNGPKSALAHPMFHYELGTTARVAEQGGVLVGFLLAFIAPGPPRTGYVHLIGIHPDYRRLGIGKQLYSAFERDARERGCQRLKAISRASNHAAIEFHRALGWAVAMVDDYAGPARSRAVFNRSLL